MADPYKNQIAPPPPGFVPNAPPLGYAQPGYPPAQPGYPPASAPPPSYTDATGYPPQQQPGAAAQPSFLAAAQTGETSSARDLFGFYFSCVLASLKESLSVGSSHMSERNLIKMASGTWNYAPSDITWTLVNSVVWLLFSIFVFAFEKGKLSRLKIHQRRMWIVKLPQPPVTG